MKAGDLVVWTEHTGRFHVNEHWGRILEASDAGTLKVKLFDAPEEPKIFKLRKQGGYKGLRLATEDEIARRRWRKAKPACKHLGVHQYQVSYSGNWYVHLDDEVSRNAADPVKLREAAVEMIAVAEWLEKEPK